MRSLLLILFFALASNAQAQVNSAQDFLAQVRSTSWKGTFHFDVYLFNVTEPATGLAKPVKVKTSETYNINVDFADQLNSKGQVPYSTSKDTTASKSFDKFVFEKIDVQPCADQPLRDIEVLGSNEDGSFFGVVHAPNCRDGKKTEKLLHVQSMKVSGDHLLIVIAENIKSMVSFQIIYKMNRVLESSRAH
jgi:hypothetical protein